MTLEKAMQLALFALERIDEKYTIKARFFLNKLNPKGGGLVVVAALEDHELPECGIACSLGVPVMGIVFIRKSFFYNEMIPEELKDFVLAHEVVHIVRGHMIALYLVRSLVQCTLKELAGPSKTSKSDDLLLELLKALFEILLAVAFISIDINTVRQQELEADREAAELVGCRGALLFADFLESLKRYGGVIISHEALLGIPALTIDERINFIRSICKHTQCLDE